MFPIYYYLYAYMQHVYAYSILGPSMQGDYAYRAAGWLLLRFIMDTFLAGGVTEAAFLQSLILATHTSGIAAIEAVVGAPFFAIMADFVLSYYMDDLGLPNIARFSHPSWNIRDIFAGLNHEFSSSFPVVHPMVAFSLAFGAFGPHILSIHGGAVAMFYLAGTQAALQLLRLATPQADQSGTGGSLPDGLGLSIIRLN
jgi:hypothetical protein